MKKLIYITLAMAVAALASCKKDDYMRYSGDARIEFESDSVKLSNFVYDDASVKRDTVYFDVLAIGGIKDTDRAFNLVQVQVPNQQNAVAGTHYIPFSDARVNANYVIKANTVRTKIPVILLRDASLKTATVQLKFKVLANENFQPGDGLKLTRRIEFTDRLSQPSAWASGPTSSYMFYYFGTYSVTKHAFLIEVSQQKWDNDFINVMTSSSGMLTYYINLSKTALIDYNNAHPGAPLTDENGQLVVFP